MYVHGQVWDSGSCICRGGQSSAEKFCVLHKPSCRHPRSLHSSEVPILWEEIHEVVIFSEVYSVSCLGRQNAQPAMSSTGMTREHLVWVPPLRESAGCLMSFWDGFSLHTIRFPNPSSQCRFKETLSLGEFLKY